MTNDQPLGGSASPRPGAAASEQNALRQYAAVLRRRWIWIALGLVVGLLAGFASTLLIKEERDPSRYFKATNTLIVNGYDSSSGSGASPNLAQAAYLIRSADVTNAVAGELAIDPAIVNTQVSATARSEVLAIDVTAISTNPKQAVLLADTTARILNEYVATDAQSTYAAAREAKVEELDMMKLRRTELEDIIAEKPDDSELERAELSSLYAQFATKTAELAVLSDSAPVGGMSTLQVASPVEINAGAYSQRYNENVNSRGGINTGAGASSSNSDSTSETNLSPGVPVSKPVRILIGGVAGLVLGLITAFVVEAWDDRVRRRERVEALTGMNVIAEVPKLTKRQRSSTDVMVADAPRSNAAERFRSVKTAILFALHEHYGGDPIDDGGASWSGKNTPVVLIGSPNPSEGKTTTVANVAAVFGLSMRTLVIDCDYHKPNVGNYLAPVPDLDHPDSPAATRLDGVWFLPAPRGVNTAESIEQIRRTIAKWRNEFDIVLLDTPPILSTNDATDLIPVADTVVLVLRAGQSRSGPAERVATVLARYGADVLGVVLNGVEASDLEAYYGYYYGYNDETRTRGTESASTNGNGSKDGSAPGPRSRDPKPTTSATFD